MSFSKLPSEKEQFVTRCLVTFFISLCAFLLLLAISFRVAMFLFPTTEADRRKSVAMSCLQIQAHKVDRTLHPQEVKACSDFATSLYPEGLQDADS